MRGCYAALVAALAFATAGCGVQDKATIGGGAEIVPASMPVFIAIDSDLGSSQWQTVTNCCASSPAVRSSWPDETVPPAVPANLEPLESLVVWGDREGRTTSFSAFLAID